MAHETLRACDAATPSQHESQRKGYREDESSVTGHPPNPQDGSTDTKQERHARYCEQPNVRDGAHWSDNSIVIGVVMCDAGEVGFEDLMDRALPSAIGIYAMDGDDNFFVFGHSQAPRYSRCQSIFHDTRIGSVSTTRGLVVSGQRPSGSWGSATAWTAHEQWWTKALDGEAHRHASPNRQESHPTRARNALRRTRMSGLSVINSRANGSRLM